MSAQTKLLRKDRGTMNRLRVFLGILAALVICIFSGCAAVRAAKTEPGEKTAPGANGAQAGIQWVTIPGGSFRMGADNLDSDARPRHDVTVRTFQMSKTLTTFGQYKKCVATGACTPPHVADGTCDVYNDERSGHIAENLPESFQGDDQPVVCVDWEQARKFSAWAGGRLPTEAEWEYAARSAGKEQKYPWGDESPTCELAVMKDASGVGCGRSATWPVCSKTAGNTKQDLCDMAGNVWEWVQDWYHDSYGGAPTDGSSWELVSPSRAKLHITRGGDWSFLAHPAARRNNDLINNDPSYRWDTIGFRPVRSP